MKINYIYLMTCKLKALIYLNVIINHCQPDIKPF